jgi:starch phosphorylase
VKNTFHCIDAYHPSVTPRRWLDQCNPELSALITKTLKLEKSVWLKDLTKLEGLLPFAENKAFRTEWAAIKQRNKERLAHYVQVSLGLVIRTDAMFDVQIKVININLRCNRGDG